MKWIFTFFLSTILASNIFAADPTPEIKLVPPDDNVKTCSLVVIKITTNGKQVILKMIPEVPTELDSSGTKFAVVFKSPGKYRIFAVTSLNDQLAQTEIVLDVKGGGQPDPTPTPNNDPLYESLKKAYNSDTTPDKEKALAILIKATQEGANASKDASVKTNKEIVDRVKTASVGIGNSVPTLRNEISKYLNGNLPPNLLQLTPDLRIVYEGTYSKIAELLVKIASE